MKETSPDWRPVPDAGGIRLLALERKPDAACSNSLALRTDDFLVMIDPGADPDQRERLLREAAHWNRPVLVVLTHAHRDHCRETAALLAGLRQPAQVLAHTAAADMLARKDTLLTLAFLYGEPAPDFTVHIRLGATSGWGDLAPRFSSVIRHGATVETLRCGTGQTIDFIPTPGHSPDSLCLRVGGHLIAGDLLFAARPGVAGIPGWDRRALLHSLASIRDILREPGLEVCHTGHRPSCPTAQAADWCDTALREAEALPDLLTLDPERAEFLRPYSSALLREINVALTRCAGRLYVAASVLEQLGENQLAQDLLNALDLDSLDRLLSDFETYALRFDPTALPVMAVPLKGVQTLDRLERVLRAANVSELLPRDQLLRARGLMRHLMNTIRGFPPLNSLTAVRLEDLAHSVLRERRPMAAPADEWFAAADTPEAFARHLARQVSLRLNRRPLPVALNIQADIPPALLESDLMAGLLATLLDQIEAGAGQNVAMATGADGGHPRLTLTADAPSPQPLVSRRQIELWTTLCSQFGAVFACPPAGTALVAGLRFPPAD